MGVKIKNMGRLIAGDKVRCIDDSFQYGLKLNAIYSVRISEPKTLSDQNRKIQLEEIRGIWNRTRFELI